MNFDIAQVASGPVTAVLASWLTSRFTTRQTGRQEDRIRRASAAEHLSIPLRDLQHALRKHGRVPLSDGEVAQAFRAFFDAYDRHGHRVPERWGHLSRSIRAAAGTALGGVSFVDLDPSAEDAELAEPDGKWRDFADDYIDYVVRRLLCWGDASPKTPMELIGFDEWLIVTGRKDPFDGPKRSKLARRLHIA